jgi:hypothetical protein
MKNAIAVFSLFLAVTTPAIAAPDKTFFGLTLDAPIDITTCQRVNERPCLGNLGTEKFVTAASGETLMAQTVHFPRELLPDWMHLGYGLVWMVNNDGLADAIEFMEDTPSNFVTAQQLNNIHQHLVAKLGKPTDHQPIKFGTTNLYYTEYWDEPWGKVIFNTVGKTDTNVQPTISIISTRFLEVRAKSLKMNAAQAAQTDAKKLKF